jgi:glycosyltransferase involved in cell wall biosynthesis
MNKVLSIIIPAFNEAKSVRPLLLQIPQFSSFVLKIFVINDGSTDNTAEIASKLGAIVISNPKNLGLGFTFKLGLFHALKENSDIIVVLDGDGQYNPKTISNLIAPIFDNKSDLVIGNRFLDNYYSEVSVIKRYANKIISIFISKILLCLNEVYDVQSSFRAFNRNVGIIIYNKLEGKYNYAQEMFLISTLYGFRITQFPVKCYKRSYGKSKLIKNPFFHLFKILFTTFKTYFKIKIIH